VHEHCAGGRLAGERRRVAARFFSARCAARCAGDHAIADSLTDHRANIDAGADVGTHDQSSATQPAWRHPVVRGQHRHNARGRDLQRRLVEHIDRQRDVQPAWRRAVLDWTVKTST
jgi:hypothetical protein